MTIMQMTNAISNLIVPPIVMKNAVTPSLEHKSPLIHYEIIKLVLVMIKKIESFVKAFEHTKFNPSEISTFKNLLLEHILKVSSYIHRFHFYFQFQLILLIIFLNSTCQVSTAF